MRDVFQTKTVVFRWTGDNFRIAKPRIVFAVPVDFHFSRDRIRFYRGFIDGPTLPPQVVYRYCRNIVYVYLLRYNIIKR